MRSLKLWLATALLYLSRRFQTWANTFARTVSRLYGVEEIAEENGLPPDDRIYFLLKRSNGMYNFHGVVAENKEAARQQAWHVPGSLIMLVSVEQFRLQLLSEADRRRNA